MLDRCSSAITVPPTAEFTTMVMDAILLSMVHAARFSVAEMASLTQIYGVKKEGNLVYIKYVFLPENGQK